MTSKSVELRVVNYNDVIGTGTFSTVYSGITEAGQQVAIKVSNCNDNNNNNIPDDDPEIKILQDLPCHSNIVAMLGTCVLDHGCARAVVFERLSGIRLYEGATRLTQYNERFACLIARQIIDALMCCHKENIVHRDLNGDNILWYIHPGDIACCLESKRPIVKLIDFNLAKSVPDETKMCYGYPMGNTRYMAPEALLDRSVISPAADVWSLGVVLYNLMAGVPPFWQDNYTRLLENISNANYSMSDDLWSHVSKDGREFIRRMLTIERDQRPTSRDMLLSSHSWLSRGFVYTQNQIPVNWKEVQMRLCLFAPYHTNHTRRDLKQDTNAFLPSKEFINLARQLTKVP